MLKAKFAVMVSGGGTNLQALIDAEKSGIIKSGKIVKVISSVEGAYALTRARNADIPSCVVSRKSFTNSEDYDNAILKELDECKADLVILAGFMSILGEGLIAKYCNIHFVFHKYQLP